MLYSALLTGCFLSRGYTLSISMKEKDSKEIVLPSNKQMLNPCFQLIGKENLDAN